MPKQTIEVTWQPHAYTTRHNRAAVAQQAAKNKEEMHRSGELRRQELKTQAEQFKAQLMNLAPPMQYGWFAHQRVIIEDQLRDQILRLACRSIPENVEDLERWVQQTPVLIEGIKAALAQRAREAAEKLTRERAEAEESRRQFAEQIKVQRQQEQQWRIDLCRSQYFDAAASALCQIDRGFTPMIDDELGGQIETLVVYAIIDPQQGARLRKVYEEQQNLAALKDRLDVEFGDYEQRWWQSRRQHEMDFFRRDNRDRPYRDGDRYKMRRWNRWQVVY